MLLQLSYFNICYAVLYAIIYLRNATFNSFVGMALIVLFNWLALVAFQKDNYRWTWFHFLAAIGVAAYAIFFAYGWYNVLSGILEAEFLSNENLYYLFSTFVLCALVMLHLVIFFKRNREL